MPSPLGRSPSLDRAATALRRGVARCSATWRSSRAIPVAMMQQVRAACGPVGEFRMLNKRVVLSSGPVGAGGVLPRSRRAAQPEDRLSDDDAGLRRGCGLRRAAGAAERAAAHPHAGAPRPQHAQLRRDLHGRGRGHGARAGAARATIDLLDFTAELTTYTSSHCLLGGEFRRSMNDEFARVYGDLEKGVNAIAYVNPYLPLPVFRRRDRARARLVEMITAIIEQRRAVRNQHDGRAPGADGVALQPTAAALTPNEITGILTASMFAGHHTSSGTEAWTLIELVRNPAWLRARRRRGRRHLRARRRAQLSGVPRGAGPGGGDQGDAPSSPAAGHPDARRASGPVGGRPCGSPPGRWSRSRRRYRTSCPSVSRTRRASIRIATAPAARRTRRRSPGFPSAAAIIAARDAAFAMMQLKAIAASLLHRFDVRARGRSRELPARLHQDGGAAAAAVPGPLSSSRRRARGRTTHERDCRPGVRRCRAGACRPRPLPRARGLRIRGARGVPVEGRRDGRRDPARRGARRRSARRSRSPSSTVRPTRSRSKTSESPSSQGGHRCLRFRAPRWRR